MLINATTTIIFLGNRYPIYIKKYSDMLIGQ